MSYMLSPNQILHPSEVPGEVRAVVAGVAQDYDVLVVRTSGWRKTGKPSIHRFDCARDYDFRSHNTGRRVSRGVWRRIVEALRLRLPSVFFDVVDEWENPSSGSTGPHVHIEYDPV